MTRSAAMAAPCGINPNTAKMHAAASLAQLLMAPPHCRSSISVQAGSCKYFGRWTQQFISLPRCNLTRWQELGFKYLAILQFCAEYTAQPRQRRKRGQDEDTIPECSGVLAVCYFITSSTMAEDFHARHPPNRGWQAHPLGPRTAHG